MYDDEKYFTTYDIAMMLHIPSTVVRHWINEGLLKAYKNNNCGVWRVKKSELVNFCKNKTFNTNSNDMLKQDIQFWRKNLDKYNPRFWLARR